MIRLTGTLTAKTPDELKVIETYLPDHIRLSRAEPGCLGFAVTQTADSMVWQLDESYVDSAAFQAHQARNRASLWWQMSQGLARNFQTSESG